MTQRIKSREITIVEDKGTFSTLFKRLYGESEGYNFDGLAALRHLLSNEKARILHTIKTHSPSSIYALAKLVKRDFKAVNEDLHALERFGIIDLIEEKSGKRVRLKPVMVTDVLKIELKL